MQFVTDGPHKHKRVCVCVCRGLPDLQVERNVWNLYLKILRSSFIQFIVLLVKVSVCITRLSNLFELVMASHFNIFKLHWIHIYIFKVKTL